MSKKSLEQHLKDAEEQWKSRQKFIKTHTIHGTKEIDKTWCGMSVYQWEEDEWEWLPLADDDSEISCKNCLQAMAKGK